MPTQADVRRIALALPETVEEEGRFAFAVPNKRKLKGYAWVWLERIHPKKARIPNPSVLAVRVASLEHKDVLLAMDPEVFFTEPHYDGYPAVMIRLAAIDRRMLQLLLREAWAFQAPKSLVAKTVSAPKQKHPRRKS